MKDGMKVVELNIEEVLPNRFQPRIKFSEDEMNELSKSIKEYGVIQPIVVRKMFDKYEIIAGERRYKASVMAGKNSIPAIIVDLNDKDSAEIALIENVQRKDLTPIEEAISYKKILDMGYTQESLAAKLGKSQSTLANKLRLLNLTDEVQEELLDGSISERHARTLLKINDKFEQINMLHRIINERLTVRQTEEEVKKMNPSLLAENTDEKLKVPVGTPIKVDDIFASLPNNGIPAEPAQTDSIPTSIAPDPIAVDNIFTNVPSDNIPLEPITPVATSDIWGQDKIEEPTPIEKPVLEESKPIENPGFMNIDKIAEEAKDIFVEKPLADTENLMKVDNNIPPAPISEETSEEMVPGKFFTLFASDDEEEVEEEKKPMVSDTPTEEEQSQLSDINNGLDMFNVVNPVQETGNEELTPHAETNNGLDMFNVSSPVQAPVLEEPKMGNVNLWEQPKSEETPTEVLNMWEEPSSIPEPLTEEKVTEAQNNNEKPGIKKAIDTVRKCADELEAMGYKLDVEEFDYEDMYQMIFKVQK